MSGASPQPLDTRRIRQKLDDLDALLERVLSLPIAPVMHDADREADQEGDALAATLDASHAIELDKPSDGVASEPSLNEAEPVFPPSILKLNAESDPKQSSAAVEADVETPAEPAAAKFIEPAALTVLPPVPVNVEPASVAYIAAPSLPPSWEAAHFPATVSTSELPLASPSQFPSMAETPAEAVTSSPAADSILYRMLAWMNRGYEAGTERLGWFGIIARSRQFRQMLGWLGGMMLAAAAAWNAGAWLAFR